CAPATRTRGPAGELVWGARVRVAGAHRLRLRLETATLPPDARLWVWGEDEPPRAFGVELRDASGGMWTPSVGGEELAVEVALPPGAVAPGDELPVAAGEVLELFGAPGDIPPPPCLVDSACVAERDFPALEAARRAVAHLEIVRGAGGAHAYHCTG